MSKPWDPKTETREWHAATQESQCDVIEAALRAQGLDVTFVEPKELGDGLLKVACIFDGPDADPEANRWTSYQEKD